MTIVNSASQESTVTFNESFNQSTIKKAHGILFETQEFIEVNDDILYVGDTVKK